MLIPLLVLATVFAFVLVIRIIESRNSLGLLLVAVAAIVAGGRMMIATGPPLQQALKIFSSAANAGEDSGDATVSNDGKGDTPDMNVRDDSDDGVHEEAELESAASDEKEILPGNDAQSDESDSPTAEEAAEPATDVESHALISVAKEEKVKTGRDRVDVSDITIESNKQFPIIPDDRPEWVEQPTDLDGDVHRIAVSSGPLDSIRHSRRELDEELRLAMETYIDDYLGKVYGDKLKASNFVSYDIEDIKHRLVKPDHMYSEIVEFSVGPMHQSHALLEIDAGFRKELDGHRADLDRQWREMVATSRLFGSGIGIAFVICSLAVVFGYFKLDTATRGYYTGSLRFVAAAAILGLIVTVALLAFRIDWM